MKTLTCDLCKHETKGTTFEEWMAENKARFDAA